MLHAIVKGGQKYPQIDGMVYFTNYLHGILVSAYIYHLPQIERPGRVGPFAFHIHQNGRCDDNFAHTGGHLNLENKDHGLHTGDFPPLFPDRTGYAYLSFFTDRFTLADIANRALVIHEGPDDFVTNPSGNSGEKIACGVILY